MHVPIPDHRPVQDATAMISIPLVSPILLSPKRGSTLISRESLCLFRSVGQTTFISTYQPMHPVVYLPISHPPILQLACLLLGTHHHLVWHLTKHSFCEMTGALRLGVNESIVIHVTLHPVSCIQSPESLPPHREKKLLEKKSSVMKLEDRL